MMRRLGHRGVTLIELLVVMTIMTFVIAASSRLLTSMLMQFKQQTKIAETSVESLVGLEVLRRDIYSSGFGLPHAFQNPSMSYNEAQSSVSPADIFNDEHTAVPRALIANIPSGTVNGSYYLVIKSLRVADNSAAGKFHFLTSDYNRNAWGTPSEDLRDNDRIIVYYFDDDNDYTLAMSGSEWRPGGTGTGKGTFVPSTNTDGLAPSDSLTTRVIYGVNEGEDDLRFPFNRADYYITNGTAPYVSNTVTPERCAPGTGVLVKAILKNDNDDTNQGGTFDVNGDGSPDEMPLLDCAADFWVAYRLDTDDDGEVDTFADGDSINDYDAKEIRTRIKEIRVYILAHEGQYDQDFEFPNSDFYVGDFGAAGHTFSLSAKIGPNWSHYRWKLYRFVIQPESLNAAMKTG